MGMPDAAHRGLTDAHFSGHRARAPMGCVGGLGLRRPTDQFLFEFGGDGRFPAGTRSIFHQTRQIQLQKPLPPAGGLLITNVQAGGDLQIGLALSS